VAECRGHQRQPVSGDDYIANGKEVDGRPSLRYLTLLRDGARAHGLPEHYIRFLDNVEEAP
jgi:gamma-glutamylcyclotransferase